MLIFSTISLSLLHNRKKMQTILVVLFGLKKKIAFTRIGKFVMPPNMSNVATIFQIVMDNHVSLISKQPNTCTVQTSVCYSGYYNFYDDEPFKNLLTCFFNTKMERS